MVTLDGFKRRKEQKKEAILNAAQRLFEKQGFEKVSLHRIAHEAHVSPVSIYNHFGSKDGLVREYLSWEVNRLVDNFRGMIREKRPYPEKLQQIIFGKTEMVGKYRGEFINEMIRVYPDFKEYFESLWTDEIEELMREFVREGKREGFIDKKISYEAVSIFFEIIRRGFYTDLSLSERIAKSQKLVREINALMLYGLNG